MILLRCVGADQILIKNAERFACIDLDRSRFEKRMQPFSSTCHQTDFFTELTLWKYIMNIVYSMTSDNAKWYHITTEPNCCLLLSFVSQSLAVTCFSLQKWGDPKVKGNADPFHLEIWRLNRVNPIKFFKLVFVQMQLKQRVATRVRTILALGYWVLGNIDRYWIVLLYCYWDIFFPLWHPIRYRSDSSQHHPHDNHLDV